MAEALKKKDRQQSYEVLKRFLSFNQHLLDIAVFCQEYGKNIYYGVTYDYETIEYCGEPIIKIIFKWDSATRTELLVGGFPVSEFPQDPFLTYFTRFWQGNSNPMGPISFDTGGGYRHLIRLEMYGHSDNSEHVAEIKKLLNAYPC